MTLQTAAANADYGTAASGSSFYAAMRILPRAQREAMFQIYSFCRQVDDIADDVGLDAAGGDLDHSAGEAGIGDQQVAATAQQEDGRARIVSGQHGIDQLGTCSGDDPLVRRPANTQGGALGEE